MSSIHADPACNVVPQAATGAITHQPWWLNVHTASALDSAAAAMLVTTTSVRCQRCSRPEATSLRCKWWFHSKQGVSQGGKSGQLRLCMHAHVIAGRACGWQGQART